MSDVESVRWMVTFFHPGGRRQDEPDFPKVDFWYPTKKASKKASMEAGERVLKELKDRGDTRDWIAAGHPDPREVGAGRHPGGQWILPRPAPRIFDPANVPEMKLTDEEWESFDRALRDNRGSSEP